MSTTQSIDPDRMKRIFFPYLSQESERVRATATRFVYYTTADVAYSILKNKEIWMRNAMTMNDYMEIEHGLDCLATAYNSKPGEAFRACLNACFPSVAEEIQDLFNSWVAWIRRDTYITCVSEHEPDEDINGRLSMWRAYGGRSGVALVFNNAVMFLQSNALAAYASPVAYFDPEAVGAELNKVAKAIESDMDFVCQLQRDGLKNVVFHTLRFAALCTKHPGFREEREWRVVASPALESSDLVHEHVEVVRGVPQTLLKIRLEDHPDKGLIGLDLTELLDRIIVGPTEFPYVVSRALCKLLSEASIPDPEPKVVVSAIPLRHV